MLYHFLKYVMRLVLPVYYRKISLEGFHRIPRHGPAILACSHPNSFLDAIIIGTYSPRVVHFLTRSDVFNTPWKQWILSKMNMVPIYRMRDGMENLDKNQETFAKCRDVLAANGVILIFSEGLCIQEMKLRPLKKGTARIAMDFASRGNSIAVVPIGLNYLHPMQYRKEVFIGVAEPFDALTLADLYQGNPARGALVFNKKLEAGLREVVIHLDVKEQEKSFQSAMELALNSRKLTLREMVAAGQRFNVQTAEPDKASPLRTALEEYTKLLRYGKLSDSIIASPARSSFVFVLSFLVATPGYLISFLPFLIVRQLVKRKVRLPEFVDSVRVAAGMVISLVLTLVIAIVLTMVYPWLGMEFVLAIVVLAKMSPIGYDRVKWYVQTSRFQLLRKSAQDLLRSKRNELVASIEASLLRD